MGESPKQNPSSSPWEWRGADEKIQVQLARRRQKELKEKSDLSEEERKELDYVNFFFDEDEKEGKD